MMVIVAGIRVKNEGGDPYLDNYYDHMGRTYNYPSVWLKFPFLDVSNENVRYIYLVFALMFCAGLGFISWNDSHRKFWLYLPFVFSPPVILALERCNIEIVVFFLISLAYFLMGRSKHAAVSVFSGAILYGATILKIFPVFGFFGFLRTSWKRSLIYLVPFGILCALHFLSVREEMAQVQANTPIFPFFSHGLSVLPLIIFIRLPEDTMFQLPLMVVLAWAVLSLLTIVAYQMGRKSGEQENEANSHSLLLFRVGSFIYLATFLIGSNFDYRLIFLLFTLPYAFLQIVRSGNLKTLSMIYLALMLFQFWGNDIHGKFFQIGNELASWGVLFVILVFQFKHAPGFVRELIYPAKKVSA